MSFFSKIFDFLKSLFINVDSWIKEHVQPSIKFVQNLKNALESPVADIVTVLIPGDVDDKIRDFLLANCGKALNALAITQDIANEPDPVQAIIKLLEYLKAATPAMKSAIYKQLASEMAKLSNGGKEVVKGHSVDLLTQLEYSKMVEEKQLHTVNSKENNDTSVVSIDEQSQEDYLKTQLAYHK